MDVSPLSITFVTHVKLLVKSTDAGVYYLMDLQRAAEAWCLHLD